MRQDIVRRTAPAALLLLLAGCAGMQVARDLKHDEDVAAYRQTWTRATEFNAAAACRAAPGINSWTDIVFDTTSPLYALGKDVTSVAACFRIPDDAVAVEYVGQSSGGLTYHEISAMRPSLLFLDDAGRIVADLPRPRIGYGSRMTYSGMMGITTFPAELADATRMVVYVHPDSLSSGVNVNTGYESIFVPFTPYGKVKIRFHGRK